MGRGLSDLQKTILKIGADEVAASKQREWMQKLSTSGNPYAVVSTSVYDICYPPPEPITAANRVAMSKAIKRLVERGLVEPRNGRMTMVWYLTPEGVAKGKELLAN